MQTYEPSVSAFYDGYEMFGGRVSRGDWAGYILAVFTYRRGGWLWPRRPAGYLVQFFRPRTLTITELDSWGEGDYTVESIEELQDSLRRSTIDWVPWHEVDDFLRSNVPELYKS